MDYEVEAKKIIGEALSVYDGFKNIRDDVIKKITEALVAAHEAGVAESKAKSAEENAAEEREACARVAEAYKSIDPIEVFAKMEYAAAQSIAKAIRARL